VCRHFNNACFARVGGITLIELNRLKLELLFRLDFKLCVTISVFESYCAYPEQDISAVEKTNKPEQQQRSLAAFGSVPTTPRASAPSTPQEMSPRFKKRPPPGPQVSYMSRTTQPQYQQPLSQYFTRNSPPSR
jgi:hypothetical protein